VADVESGLPSHDINATECNIFVDFFAVEMIFSTSAFVAGEISKGCVERRDRLIERICVHEQEGEMPNHPPVVGLRGS